jgi:hypothetical protein
VGSGVGGAAAVGGASVGAAAGNLVGVGLVSGGGSTWRQATRKKRLASARKSIQGRYTAVAGLESIIPPVYHSLWRQTNNQDCWWVVVASSNLDTAAG